METDNTKPTCSVLIPVYNSERSLPLLVERLHAELPKLCSEYEIILVNDDSRDGSWHAIQELCAADARVVGIDLMRNFGQHNALLCGIRQARYELILTMDDDLQHPPEEAHKLFARLAEGFDVVYGAPEVERHGFWRDLTSRLIKGAAQADEYQKRRDGIGLPALPGGDFAGLRGLQGRVCFD